MSSTTFLKFLSSSCVWLSKSSWATFSSKFCNPTQKLTSEIRSRNVNSPLFQFPVFIRPWLLCNSHLQGQIRSCSSTEETFPMHKGNKNCSRAPAQGSQMRVMCLYSVPVAVLFRFCKAEGLLPGLRKHQRLPYRHRTCSG